MTNEQLTKRIDNVSQNLAPMLGRFMDTARIRLATTATQEYMRDGGHTNPPFPPRRSQSGPLRILSGRLARSLTGARTGGGSPEGISEVEVSKTGASMRYGTRVPYAAVHEEGFIGWVEIPAHTRTIVQAFGRPLDRKTTVNVSAHRRFMTIPARPYLGPASDDNEEQLQQLLSVNFQKLVLDSIDGK